MKDASTRAMFGTALRVALLMPLGFALTCIAQERAGMQAARAFPFSQDVVAGAKSARVDNGMKHLHSPVMDPIAPDARSQSSLVLPEHRTLVDEMLQSHEFKFGTKQRASTLAAKTPPVGTNMDLDAVKLRISRNKVMFKAEWKFN